MEKNLLMISVVRIIHQDLHLYSCKIQILQLQPDGSKAERRVFGKTSVSESKTILISWTAVLSVTSQISTSMFP